MRTTKRVIIIAAVFAALGLTSGPDAFAGNFSINIFGPPVVVFPPPPVVVRPGVAVSWYWDDGVSLWFYFDSGRRRHYDRGHAFVDDGRHYYEDRGGWVVADRGYGMRRGWCHGDDCRTTSRWDNRRGNHDEHRGNEGDGYGRGWGHNEHGRGHGYGHRGDEE